MNAIPCPKCEKRAFDASDGAVGEIELKCPHCGSIVKIPLPPKRILRVITKAK